MKQIKLIQKSLNQGLLLVLLLFTTAYTQAQWQLQVEYEEGTKSFKEVFFIDENTGYVADRTGAYLYTTNGGETWQENSAEQRAFDIVFTSPDTGFVCYENQIKKTTNAGQNWFAVWDEWADMTKLSFAGDQAWAKWTVNYGCIVTSENSGNFWQSNYVFTDMLQVDIYTLFLVKPDTGWVYLWRIDTEFHEYTEIYKTENGGDTWILKNDSPSLWLTQDMFFVNDSTGWFVGGYHQPTILYTNDDGETWTYQELIDGENLGRITCVYFTNASTGWLSTAKENGGTIYYTIDSGNTWNKQTEYNKPIYDIYMLNENEGWAIGANTIYHYYNNVNIKENKQVKFDFTILPNPCKDKLILRYALQQNTNIVLKICDITGIQIFTKQYKNQAKGSHRQEIDLTGLNARIYFIKINNQTKKIIKL